MKNAPSPYSVHPQGERKQTHAAIWPGINPDRQILRFAQNDELKPYCSLISLGTPAIVARLWSSSYSSLSSESLRRSSGISLR